MEIKILQVFYDKNGLPFKDKERKVHFPVIGSGFQGASNTTQIRFYYGQVGDESTTWVATTKLPNGKIGSKVLGTFTDTEINEDYALLELNSFYFQHVGNVFISLQGYEGGVEVSYNAETELYEIHGTPTIQSTGSIKIAVNYATQFIGSGEEDNVTLQQIFANFATKLNTTSPFYFKHVSNIANINSPSYEPFIQDGDIVYCSTTNAFYDIVEENFVLVAHQRIIDNNQVQLTGNQVIGGEKAFSSQTKFLDGVFVDNGDDYAELTSQGFVFNRGIGYDDDHRIQLNIRSNLWNFKISQGEVERNLSLPFENGTVATQTYVDNAIAEAEREQYKKVNITTYPTLEDFLESTGQEGYVYLYPIDTSESPNFESGYYRYIWEDNDWVDLGTTQIDLSDYITREEAVPFIVNTIEALIGCASLDDWRTSIHNVTIKEFYDAGFRAGKYYIATLYGNRYLIYVSELTDEYITPVFILPNEKTYTCKMAGRIFYTSTTTFGSVFSQTTTYTDLYMVDAVGTDSFAATLKSKTQVIFKLGSTSGAYIGSYKELATNQLYQVEIESLAGTDRWSTIINGYSNFLNTTINDIMVSGNRADYEISKNKVTSLSNLSTDTQYPSAKCVWDITYNIREVAEGKCKTFVLSNDILRIENGRIMYDSVETMSAQPDLFYVYENGKWVDRHTELYNGDYDNLNIVNTMFKEDQEDIWVGETDGYIIMGTLSSTVYLYNIRGTRTDSGISHYPFKAGDIFLVVETNVPDRWYDFDFERYYKLETGKINLTNYPTLNGNNTFTGTNTFGANVYVDTILGKTQPSYGLNIGNGWVAALGNFMPYTNNNRDLGGSSNNWKDLYLKGYLISGSYSMSVEAIYRILRNYYETTDTTELDWLNILTLSKNANTTFTLKASAANTLPEYKATIRNIGSSAITLTFTGVTNILCNDDNIVVTNATNSTLVLPANVTIEVSIMNNKMIAINFEAQ